MDKAQIKHDFLNNCIRIEVIQKMISKSIEENQPIDEKYREDLINFMQEQVKLIKAL